MKKIFISFLLITSLFFGLGIFQSLAADGDCSFDVDGDSQNIGYALEDCFEDAGVVNTSKGDGITLNLKAEGGFKIIIEGWVKIMGSILAILAVGSIVYGSLLLVLSGGEEEKLKKGKDVIKWGILGFLGVVFAGALITIVVNIMFSI